MNTKINVIGEERLKVILGDYAAYKGKLEHLETYNHTDSPYDFEEHNRRMEEVFSQLVGILDTWGNQDINFRQLERIFELALVHDPERAKKTFTLFSTLFQLVAVILQHGDIIRGTWEHHTDIAKDIDSFGDQGNSNREIIFNKAV